jgi:hypothetical protein
MAVAKKHHYVPRMYLSGFANAAGQLYAVNAEERKCFRPRASGIAAERDFNTIDAEGVPPDALEKELAKLEGEIAPGIKRIRETASFGKNGKDREDAINLIALMALRNPRSRKDMGELYSQLVRAMLLMAFEEKERWEAWVEDQKKAGHWPQDKPADCEGYKQFVEEHINGLRVHQNFTLEMELNALEEVYHYFDARKWRILKAKEGSGGFVTTDHPVCVHRQGGTNYGQQYAPGLGLSDRDVLIALSSKVALLGRLEGEEDVIEVDKHTVASFNATVMGYAMKQIYAGDDGFFYTRAAPQPLGTALTLLQDPNLKVREGDEGTIATV